MNSRDSAFPLPPHHLTDGLTKREYASIQILAGIMASGPDEDDEMHAAQEAVTAADKLFKKLEQ